MILRETQHICEGNANPIQVSKGSEINVYEVFILSKRHALGCLGTDSLRRPEELLEPWNSKRHYHKRNKAYFLQTS